MVRVTSATVCVVPTLVGDNGAGSPGRILIRMRLHSRPGETIRLLTGDETSTALHTSPTGGPDRHAAPYLPLLRRGARRRAARSTAP